MYTALLCCHGSTIFHKYCSALHCWTHCLGKTGITFSSATHAYSLWTLIFALSSFNIKSLSNSSILKAEIMKTKTLLCVASWGKNQNYNTAREPWKDKVITYGCMFTNSLVASFLFAELYSSFLQLGGNVSQLSCHTINIGLKSFHLVTVCCTFLHLMHQIQLGLLYTTQRDECGLVTDLRAQWEKDLLTNSRNDLQLTDRQHTVV